MTDLRHFKLQMSRMNAQIAALKNDQATYNLRIAELNSLKESIQGQVQPDDLIDCFFCAESIKFKANICRYCYRIQPSSVRFVIEQEIIIRNKISNAIKGDE